MTDSTTSQPDLTQPDAPTDQTPQHDVDVLDHGDGAAESEADRPSESEADRPQTGGDADSDGGEDGGASAPASDLDRL